MNSQIESLRETADSARSRVKELFRNRGTDVADDFKNFDALLRDRFAGEFRRERGTLVFAAQQGIPTRLRRASAAAGPHQLLAQCAENLREEGLDSDSAHWAAETFAEILRPDILPPNIKPPLTDTKPAPAEGKAPAAPPRKAPVQPPQPPQPSANEPQPTPEPRHGSLPKAQRSPTPLLVIGLLTALFGISYAVIQSSNTSVRPAAISSAGPLANANEPPVTSPQRYSPTLAPLIPTKICSNPNAADDEQMRAAITHYHQAVMAKQWSAAQPYVNTASYQDEATFNDGYARTAESIPTILRQSGCTVTVALRYSNQGDPQHYCIEQDYFMEYTQRWIINNARSISPKTTC